MTRKRYTDADKAQAIDLYVNGGLSLDAVAAQVGCSKWSVREWLRKAGVDVAALAAERGKFGAAQTEAGRGVMVANGAKHRAELLDLLRERVTLRSARLLADILDRAEQDTTLVHQARDRWRDALAVEAQAADFGPDAVKDAKRATAAAKVDLLVAEAAVPSANDLSLILRRSVTDMLAIEGYEHDMAEEDADGRLTVVFTAPRPDRGNLRVVQLQEENRPA